MKKVLLVLGVLAFLGGVVFAEGRIVFEDSGFDYFDSDDGYVAIDFADGVFTLSLSDSAVESAAEISDIDLLPLDEDTDFSEAAMRRYLPIEVTHSSATILHKASALDEVMASYDTQLINLGFSSSVEQASSNSTIMLYEQGDTTARVVFTRQGEDVKVSMNAL